MIDQKEVVGGATAVFGAAALFYADWKFVPLTIVLVLLIGLCSLVALLVPKNRWMLSAALVFSVILSYWWRGESGVSENGWHPGPVLLIGLTSLFAAAATAAGVMARHLWIDQAGRAYQSGADGEETREA